MGAEEGLTATVLEIFTRNHKGGNTQEKKAIEERGVECRRGTQTDGWDGGRYIFNGVVKKGPQSPLQEGYPSTHPTRRFLVSFLHDVAIATLATLATPRPHSNNLMAATDDRGARVRVSEGSHQDCPNSATGTLSWGREEANQS